ncbi:MAG: hypothetical protein FJ290_12935 [Planctomycetes bacterium]|nr:hypothetical protein [Planctomycetota bacterium]
MRRTNGSSLSDLLIMVAMLIGVALLYTATRPRERVQSGRLTCRNNLNQLAKGMATYLNECGDNRFYPWPAGRAGCGTVANPNFAGAEWLATLYWTRIIPDPGFYYCPSSPDNNEQGAELGSIGGPGGKPLSADAVSYAAFGHKSVGIYLCSKQDEGAACANSILPIKDDFPPNEPMASDDTQGPIHHGERDNGGMAVLFFDSHVEYWTHNRLDLETGVGQGDLCALRN